MFTDTTVSQITLLNILDIHCITIKYIVLTYTPTINSLVHELFLAEWQLETGVIHMKISIVRLQKHLLQPHKEKHSYIPI